MLKFLAREFIRANEDVATIKGLLLNGKEDDTLVIDKGTRGTIDSLFTSIENLNLPLTKLSVQRMKDVLVEESVRWGVLKPRIEDIQSRMADEIGGVLFLVAEPTTAHFYDKTMDYFGSDIEKMFPSAIEDLDESGKALALGRNTACCFHLGRALEIAVAMAGTKLGASIIDNCGKGLAWGVIAQNMKLKIDAMTSDKPLQVRWYRVHSFLEAFNRAWRAPTAHPKQTYTREESQDVMNTARALMNELASLV